MITKEQLKEIIDLVHGKGNYQVINNSVYVYLTANNKFCKFIYITIERDYDKPYLKIFNNFQDFKKAIEEYINE